MSKSHIIISFFCILFLHSAKAKDRNENAIFTVTISNYNLQDIYATAVRVNAIEVYDGLKLPFGSPIKAIVAKTNVKIPAILTTFEGKRFIQLYLSIKANQSVDILISPSTEPVISEIRSFQWDKKTHTGFLSNGLVKLQYNDDKWDLILETVGENSISENERTVLQNGAYYG